jgi:hypothetical protein
MLGAHPGQGPGQMALIPFLWAWIYAFLTLTDMDAQFPSRSCIFYLPQEKAHCGPVGHRGGLEMGDEDNNPCPAVNRTTVVNPGVYRY